MALDLMVKRLRHDTRAQMAVPIFWLAWAAFSVAVLIASVSVPSSAFFS